MKTNGARKLLAAVVSLCLMLSVIPTVGFSASAKMDRDTSVSKLSASTIEKLNSFNVKNDEIVTSIITLEGKSMIDLQLSGASQSVKNRMQVQLSSQHNAVESQMSKSFEYELIDSYSVLFNGLAIKTKFCNLSKIAELDGVTGVYLTNKYNVPDVDEVPQMDFADDITGVSSLRQYGLRGEGTVVAVLDTGLRTTHEAFKDNGNLESVALTKEKVSSIETSVKGKWLSDKVPFSYDYADKDNDVSDVDGHGTHVSGIVLGETIDELGAVTFQGAAPHAQLLSMKIFYDEETGTSSEIYFSALEDAYLLGADVINMSIGSANGFTHDKELETEVFGNIYKKLEQAGVIVCISAGNEYSMAYSNYSAYSDTVPAEYADYGTIGSPSTYEGALSIASVENTNFPGYTFTVGDTNVLYDDASEDLLFLNKFSGKTVKYVVVPNFGESKDYELVQESIKDLGDEEWIAVTSRGTITFQEKTDAAAAAGAAGLVVFNNQEGTISMAIDDYKVPAVSVLQKFGEILVNGVNESGYGELTVLDSMTIVENDLSMLMSDFSCWGTTSDLKFKPQLTAPGGQIYSAANTADDKYVVYSGTSMAAPNAAGAFACLIQALRETYTEKADCADFAKSSVLSTADLLFDDEGYLYSPRKQGVGSMNAVNALSTSAIIINPIAEFGDDAEKAGKYTISYTVKNISDKKNDIEYHIEPIVLVDYLIEDEETNRLYNTLVSDYLSDIADYVSFETNLENDTIVFPANSETDEITFTLTITLSEDCKQYLNDLFANGCFIEGYVNLVPKANDIPEIHGSFLGFYGNWLDGQILETNSFADAVQAEYELNNTVAETYTDTDGSIVEETYGELGYTYEDVLDMTVGINEAYAYSAYNNDGFISFLGDNFNYYSPYVEKHNAISNAESNSFYYTDYMVAFPTQLRNVRHMIMVVSDSVTGEVYYVDDTEYLPKATYDFDYSMYLQNGTFMWDGTYAYDTESENYEQYVPNNTEATVSFFAWIDYDTETEAAFQALEGDYSALISKDEWQKYNVWEFPVTVDNEAPTISDMSWDSKENVLKVTLLDNQYLAYVGIYDQDKEVITDTDPLTGMNESFEMTIDFDEIYDEDGDGKADYIPESVFIDFCDYATNWPTMQVTLSDNGLATSDYTVDVYVNDVKSRFQEVTLVSGENVYEYGDAVPFGTYDIYINGYYSNSNITIGVGTDNQVDVYCSKLKFDANGGNDGKIKSVVVPLTVGIAQYLTTEEGDIPTKEGYEFDGWVNKDGSELTGEEVMTDGGITVYASWKETKTLILGDIDGDGVVTMIDVVMLQRHIASIDILTESQLAVADVNQDGEILMVDVVAMQRIVAGIVD